MNKSIIITAAFLMFMGGLQAALNLTWRGELKIQGSRLSDIWGYADGLGKEYAIVGLESGGVAIVDVTNASLPVEVFYRSGPPTGWWDIKTWDNHAYVTNENSGGLMIIDLNGLPGSNLNVNYFTAGGWSSAHNLYIDENGICYIFGANRGKGGVIMYDLTNDPKIPVEVGAYDAYYAHDGMARGDTLYAAHINDGWFSILDVSDKANPVLLATSQTPSNKAHNVWVSDDGDYLFTTDEVANGFIAAYDISDLGNITELDRIQSSPGENVIPHNVHFINNYLVTSYYNDGAVIHDVSRPHNLVEVGNYDTAPNISGSGFTGAWGVYPWLPSGNIIVSDVLGGLFILAPQYVRGCYLEGTITDANTHVNLHKAVIEILSTGEQEVTDLIGKYATGTAQAGTHKVVFRKYGYRSDTVDVTLSNGNVTVINKALEPLVPFALTGLTISSKDGSTVASCQVKIFNEDFEETFFTDQGGNLIVTNFFESSYDIYIGKWGYVTQCYSVYLSKTNDRLVIELDEGYYDDFTFDFGWTVSGNASSGAWERGAPIGTFYGPIEVHPGSDINHDCSESAYTTGNDGDLFNEVDGVTILTSPVFDATKYSDPYVNYFRWFFNYGQNIQPGNDSLIAYLSNGIETVGIDSVLGAATPVTGWEFVSLKIADYIAPSTSMQFIVKVSDRQSQGGHITEGGLDEFQLSNGPLSLSIEQPKTIEATVYPNPVFGNVNVRYKLESQAIISLYDIYGKEVYRSMLAAGSDTHIIDAQLVAGMYIIRIWSEGYAAYTSKLMKVR